MVTNVKFGPALVRYLDPGVRRLVVLLNEWGFATVDSGDGVSKPRVGRMYDVPHVFCEVEPARIAAEADRLAHALAGIGIRVKAQGRGKFIAAHYDPVTRSASIALFGVTDSDLPPTTAPATTPTAAARGRSRTA